MFLRSRVTRQFVVFASIGALGIIGLLAAGKSSGAAAKDVHGYIRAIEPNSDMNEILDELGVKGVSLAIRCPDGHKAAVSRVVTDRTGNIINDSSCQTAGFYDPAEPREWTIRLTKLDPRAFTDNYNGRIRWRMVYRSKNGALTHSGSTEMWDQDWFHAKDAVGGSWGGAATIEDVIPEKEYTVWEATVQKLAEPDERGPDDNVLYRYRLLVKFLKSKPGDEGFVTSRIRHEVE